MEFLNIGSAYKSRVAPILSKFNIKSTSFLRVTARVLLLLWFVNICIYTCFSWPHSVSVTKQYWRVGYHLAAAILMINLVGTLVSCWMVLLQKHVLKACGFLACMVAYQTATFMLMHDFMLQIFLNRCSIVGGLFLILSEHLGEDFSQLPGGGVESSSSDRRRSLLQLFGRCLLVFMFVSHVLALEPSSLLQVLQEVVASTLLVLVILGYKTRVTALSLAVYLAFSNFYRITQGATQGEHLMSLRYRFFESWTVIGGLLMIVVLGPGGISVDEAKKLL